MELGRRDVQLTTEPRQTCVSGKLQETEWCQPQQHYLHLTSRGRHNTAQTQPAAASIHPLLPLLRYSDQHLAPPSSYSQPITAPSGTRPRYHSNGVSSRGQLVKKPLNAFMLYMKEMRHKVLQEGRERESAAINRILGRRWRALPRCEQAKYYELAHKERLLHTQLHPGWTAKDNYGKRKRRRSQPTPGRFETRIGLQENPSPAVAHS